MQENDPTILRIGGGSAIARHFADPFGKFEFDWKSEKDWGTIESEPYVPSCYHDL